MKHNLPLRAAHLQASPEGLLLWCRGQGQLTQWKVCLTCATPPVLLVVQVVLTDSDQLGLTSVYTYEHKFTLTGMEERRFEEVGSLCLVFLLSPTPIFLLLPLSPAPTLSYSYFSPTPTVLLLLPSTPALS